MLRTEGRLRKALSEFIAESGATLSIQLSIGCDDKYYVDYSLSV